MKSRFLIITLVAVLCVPSEAPAQSGSAPRPDPRIKRALDQAKLKYEVDEDGDYKLTFELENKRSQLVLINSQTETFGELEIREIWALGYMSENPFSAAVANRLLDNNEITKLGAWQTKKLNGKYTAVFTAKVSAVMSPEHLEMVLAAVYQNADEIEKELTGKDDY